MSLLDQLWDDTVAGPRPESGLGKLRKYASFSPSSSSPSSSVVVTSANAAVFAPNITRSITVIRTPPSSAASSPRGASVPSSPAAAPESPFACEIPCSYISPSFLLEASRSFRKSSGRFRNVPEGLDFRSDIVFG